MLLCFSLLCLNLVGQLVLMNLFLNSSVLFGAALLAFFESENDYKFLLCIAQGE